MPKFAGEYAEDLQDIRGNGYKNAKVAVQTLGGDPATLYLNRLKGEYVPASGLAVNEIKADSKGNVRFFAEPGHYQIVVTPAGGSTLSPFPASVLPDPLETEQTYSSVSVENIRYKRHPFVDVTHPDFGAVPGQDSTAAFQEAINEIDARVRAGAYGGTLFIPIAEDSPNDKGFVIADELDVPCPILIQGAHIRGSRLDVDPAFATAGGSVFRAYKGVAATGSYDHVLNESHMPGFDLRDIHIYGAARVPEVAGVSLDFRDRMEWRNVRFESLRRGAIDFQRSIRESEFYSLYAWTCGDALLGHPVYDLADAGSTTDGHNLLSFYGCVSAYPMGDHAHYGSGSAATVVRTVTWMGCTFHGLSELAYSYLDNPDRWSLAGGRHRFRNARSVRYLGCRFILPGYGHALFVLEEDATLGSATSNQVNVTACQVQSRSNTQEIIRTFTADPAADIVTTATVHYMALGARVRLTTTGTLPAPLQLTTDYFVISAGDSTLQLATSYAGALGVVAVDLTDAGSGVHTITSQSHLAWIRDAHVFAVGGNTFIETNTRDRGEVLLEDSTATVRLGDDTTRINEFLDATGSVTSLSPIDSYSARRGPAGTQSLPAFGFKDDPNTGLYWVGTDTLGFTTGGIPWWTVGATGRLSGYFFASAGNVALATRVSGDTQDRFLVQANGSHSWGPGGGTATDLSLSRSAASVLALGADDCLVTGKNATGSRPSASAVGQGAQFYDTTLNKPIWSTGSAWVDASGATV